MTADDLAARLAPAAIQALKNSTPEILANSPGMIHHAAIRAALPVIEQNMKVLLRDAINVLISHLDAMTLHDIVKLIGELE